MIPPEPEYYEDDVPPPTERRRSEPISYRAAGSDPMFGYLVALALALGLSALPVEQYDLRYTLAWMALAGFGVLAWLLGTTARIGQESVENLAWGVVFGLIIATPLLAVGGSTLTTTVNLLFRGMSAGVVLAYLVFVMPLAETLFFRGLMQTQRPFWVVGLMASLWGALLFLPLLDIQRFPVVVFVIGLALVLMNMIYSYVRRRNGLAAAWVCQIVVNLVLLFFPYASG